MGLKIVGMEKEWAIERACSTVSRGILS